LTGVFAEALRNVLINDPAQHYWHDSRWAKDVDALLQAHLGFESLE
jgi:hypothetical protein